MLWKWERTEKQRIPKIVVAQKAVVIGANMFVVSNATTFDVCEEANVRRNFVEVP